MKEIIQTSQAPAPIGCYSPAIKIGKTIYFSGQIPLDPKTMTIVSTDIKDQVIQVFENIKAMCFASGGSLSSIVKLTVYLTDISYGMVVNDVMKDLFVEPYPARTTIAVVALPKKALVEIEAIMCVE